jgi:hypothetical protein
MFLSHSKAKAGGQSASFRLIIHQFSSLGFEVLTAVKSSILCDETASSPLRVSRWFGWTSRLHLQGRRISQARNQKTEATCSSETPVDFQQTTRRYIWNPARSFGGAEDSCCSVVKFEGSPTFRRNTSPPSSGSKSKYGDSSSLRNVVKYLPGYTASNPIGQYFK